MPLEYRIDRERRTVFARGSGTLTHEDVFGYQTAVWSRPDVAGYNELVDMRAVEAIALPSNDHVRMLADFSAQMDQGNSISRFAIVASDDVAFGIGRMYEAYRDMNERSTKQVAVFRTMESALEWLGTGPAGASAGPDSFLTETSP